MVGHSIFIKQYVQFTLQKKKKKKVIKKESLISKTIPNHNQMFIYKRESICRAPKQKKKKKSGKHFYEAI